MINPKEASKYMDNLEFLHEIENASDENISSCYQCYKCSIGCPVAAEMDVLPHRIIRHIINGNQEKVLGSKSIWMCLQCKACSVRCPNDIDIAHVIDTLRKISVKLNMYAEKDIRLFDNLFLESIKARGRLYELEVLMKYKIAKKDILRDTKMGIDMIFKGRMGILPHNIKDRKTLKTIFKKIEDDRTNE